MEIQNQEPEKAIPFYEQPGVQLDVLPFGPGIPMGTRCVTNELTGLGGAYGAWGKAYDNDQLPALVEERLGESLGEGAILNLAELGFVNRHHLMELPPEADKEVEVEVGSRFLRAAAQACGWEPAEVDAAIIGISAPVADDYVEQIARRAGLPEDALTVSIHKACDSSVGGLHLALNPDLPEQARLGLNLAEKLRGKKVLVGGIEGLSHFLGMSRDKNAMQIFGNGAGVIGIIPGKTIKFLVGKSREAFDEEGMLQVHMFYPYVAQTADSMISVLREGSNHFRISGRQHEPNDDNAVVMAGLMGMVKLFVRNGVLTVSEAYRAYQERMASLGQAGKQFAVAIVHHANLKINRLVEKNLQREGIELNMPWLLSEFGNVSAASNMIAFLRALPALKPGDHILMDGFGAGTYYDVLALEIGSA